MNSVATTGALGGKSPCQPPADFSPRGTRASCMTGARVRGSWSADESRQGLATRAIAEGGNQFNTDWALWCIASVDARPA